ncbi:MAG: hypothetical protein U1E12_04990 [Hydrogenophaga sp.]|uniref:hypothetical protein n=1 Tax=Hydrogenophaga sp. TaxID=1904254 RepID=UPI002ABB37F8|nr:hypothetical protein [Hydrogenophaga sp.]MDZ4101016.1 hypothetical protein [Hydrogenophaga sp.]
MPFSFHAKSISLLTLSAALLGAGLYTAKTGSAALVRIEAQETALSSASRALTENRRNADAYAQLIERIGWRQGQDLRHELINTTATIADHESDRLNEILKANHVGKGHFFLRSLSISAVGAGARGKPAVSVTMQGDNILVLDRP